MRENAGILRQLTHCTVNYYCFLAVFIANCKRQDHARAFFDQNKCRWRSSFCFFLKKPTFALHFTNVRLINQLTVKQVHITLGKSNRETENLVLLTEKDRLELLNGVLTPSELAFLQKSVAKSIKSVFFPRESSAIWVQILSQGKDTDGALEDARLAGNDLLKELNHYKAESVLIENYGKNNMILAFAEGLALGSYQFLKYFTKSSKKEKQLTHIQISSEAATPAEVEELNYIIQSVFIARTLVNEPLSYLDVPRMSAEFEAIGKKAGFQVEILGREKLETLKMGGLLSVNRASDTPPNFIIAEYRPANAKNEKPIVLVGKGVVYDTGGLSLKPSDGMDYMKCDMAGAATVLGAMHACALNKLPLYIIGLVPATDNKIGEKALAPGDIIQMYSGKTVEVVNTDAEGRLILADALHYAKKYNPELVLDFATLTGAAVRALGNQAICYMGNASKKTKSAIEESGWATYERLVELPLWKEYGDDLKSNIADLRNMGSSNAGMITAGKFLEHFVDFPWLHLDIAGPAYLKSANGYRTKEGTGIGVRLMYHFLKNLYH